MLKRFTILFIAFTVSIALSAQEYHSPCGTTGELARQVAERLLKNKEAFQNGSVQFRDDITYVPIKFHLVARTSGTGRVKERYVFDQLCALNEDFADLDIQFYIKDGFNYMNNTAVYDNHITTTGTIMTFGRDPGAINIWIVQDATPEDEGLGTTLGYYSPNPNFDWIVIRIDEVGDDNSTLPHEVGHFFSLPHPHNGWDAAPWTPADPGNPTPMNSPGGVPTEMADGSNCEEAGDFLCDTPADYNGFGWPNCNYDGGAQDPTGVEIDPEEKLFMSYFLNCPRDDYYYSPEQKEMMITDLMSPKRNYVRPGITPNTNPITEEATPLSPVGGPTNIVEGYNAVNFEWAAVAGADVYLLEISNSPVGDPQFSIIVYGTSKVVGGLNSFTVYHWTVRPFNNYATCQPKSASASFRTGLSTGVDQPEFIDAWSVSPNPARINETLTIELDSKIPFEANIQLYNIDGKMITQLNRQVFTAGANTLNISTAGMAPGAYLVAIRSSEGLLRDKVILTR